MTTTIIDLKRRLAEQLGDTWSEADEQSASILGKSVTWDDIVENDVSIVIGQANSGKTTEFQRQVALHREQGRHACLVEVRELLRDGDVFNAIRRGEAQALATWKQASPACLTLFVDSIDEGALLTAKDLGAALRKLTKAVDFPNRQVHWIFSTRPVALSSEVESVISEELDTETRQVRDVAPHSRDWSAAPLSTTTTTSTQKKPTKARKYRLLRLTRAQAELYLRERGSGSDVAPLMEAANRHGLGSLLFSPGKLEILRNLDLVARPPVSLTDVYERSIQWHLEAPTNDRDIIISLPRDMAERVTEQLACAVTLCQKLNIEAPEDGYERNTTALSARLFGGQLLDSQLRYVLMTALFEDSGHLQVKFVPDEFRVFLAAQRLDKLIRSQEDARRIAELLCWDGPSGESGVFREWLSLAGWLASRNTYFRTECLTRDPQCIAFFGDLRSVPANAATAALRGALVRLKAGQDVREILTSEKYWQAGSADLGPALGELYDEFATDAEARHILIQIAKHARNLVLRERLLREVDGLYGSLISDADSLSYFLSVGTSDDHALLTKAALELPALPERGFSKLIRHFAWSRLGCDQLMSLLEKAAADRTSQLYVAYSLAEEAAPRARTEQLLELCDKILDTLDGLSQEDSEYLPGTATKSKWGWWREVVADLLVKLAERRLTDGEVALVARTIARFYLGKRGYGYGYADEHSDDLRGLLVETSPLRDATLAAIIEALGDDESQLHLALLSPRVLISPTTEELRRHGASSLAAAIERSAARSEPTPTRRSRAERREEAAVAKAKEELLKRIDGIRNGTDLNSLLWIAQDLSRSVSISRYGDVSLTEFSKTFGSDLGAAAQEGLSILWRTRVPLGNDANPSQKYWSTLAGLQGITLELSAHPDSVQVLGPAEVERALDYGLYEINGMPKWYWAVVRSDMTTAVTFLSAVLAGFAKSPLAKERATSLLTSLAQAPDEVRLALAPHAWTVAKESVGLTPYELSAALRLASSFKVASEEDFGSIAQARLAAATDETAPIWAVHWLSIAPSKFVAALDSIAATSPERARELVCGLTEQIADGLVGFPPPDTAETISALTQLFRRISAEFRREDDVTHPDGVVYSVDARDKAQQVRDSLPSIIASANNAASYTALHELSKSASHLRERERLRAMAVGVAEAMRRRPPMSERAYLQFERDLQPVATTQEAFAQEIANDILEIKENIEKGEFSPRRFLSTWFQDLSADEIRAREDDFQLFLAGQLERLGHRRYSVSREPQLAEATRRDILISHSPEGWNATLELKVSLGNWRLTDYRRALEYQLVGQYMRARNAKIGFLVLLLQKDRRWKGPEGKYLTFPELLELLQSDAQVLQAADPSLRLQVIGIDAREPKDAGHTTARLARKKGQ